jgi:hypothetical protein
VRGKIVRRLRRNFVFLLIHKNLGVEPLLIVLVALTPRLDGVMGREIPLPFCLPSMSLHSIGKSAAHTFSTSLSYSFMPNRPLRCGLYVAIYFIRRASSSLVNATLCLEPMLRLEGNNNKEGSIAGHTSWDVPLQ